MIVATAPWAVYFSICSWSSASSLAFYAKARDRDGDLLDGENAVTPGADRW